MSSLNLWLVGVGSRVSLFFLSAINFVIVARFLGPHDRGQFFLFLSLLAVLAVLGELGLSQSAIVFSADREVSTASVYRVLMRLVMRSALVTGTLSMGIMAIGKEALLPGFPMKWIYLAALLLPVSLYSNVWGGVMVGLGKIVALNSVHMACSAISVMLNGVVIGVLKWGIEGAVGVFVVMAVFQLVVMVMMMKSILGEGKEKIDYELSREVFSFGLRGYLNSIATLLWMRCNIFLLNFYHGATAVGIFSVANQLAEKMFLPGQALQDVLYRRVTAFERHEAIKFTNLFLRLSICGLILGGVLVAWLGGAVIPLIFGVAYSGSVEVFRVLLIGSCVMNVPILLAPYFVGQLRRPGLLSILAWANVGINIILSVVLIPVHAELGTAIALAITQVLGTAVVFFMYLRSSRSVVSEAIMLRGDDLWLTLNRAQGALLKAVQRGVR